MLVRPGLSVNATSRSCAAEFVCGADCSTLSWSVPFGLSEVRNSSPDKTGFVEDLRPPRWFCARAPYLACLPQLTTSPGHDDVPRLLSKKYLLLQGLEEQ